MRATRDDEPELLTIRDSARLIGTHPNTLRNWERQGKIRALRLGPRRDRRFQRRDLLNLLSNISTKPRSLPPFRAELNPKDLLSRDVVPAVRPLQGSCRGFRLIS